MLGSASAITGSTTLRHSPQPPAGSHCSVTANSSTSSGAATNFGIASPRPAANISPRSVQRPARNAAHTPSGMPTPSASSSASPPLSADTGSAVAISWLTV